MSQPLSVHLDDVQQIATIEGIRYTYDLFRAFGKDEQAGGLQLHQPFTITQREDGCLVITKSADPQLMAIVEHVEGLLIGGNNLLIVKCHEPPNVEQLHLLRQQLVRRLGFTGVIYCMPSDWTIERLSPKDSRRLYERLRAVFEGKPMASPEGFREGLLASVEMVKAHLGVAYPVLAEHLERAIMALVR